jgi:hypothetical protein
MPNALSDYARLAGEAFVAANREADPRQSALLRQRGYDLVERIREQRGELEGCREAAETPDR